MNKLVFEIQVALLGYNEAVMKLNIYIKDVGGSKVTKNSLHKENSVVQKVMSSENYCAFISTAKNMSYMTTVC